MMVTVPLGALPQVTVGPPVRPDRRVSRCSGVWRRGAGTGCDNVAVPTSTDGWYPRSFVLTDIVDSVSLWERDAELMSRAVPATTR